jgi:hypothetical protein
MAPVAEAHGVRVYSPRDGWFSFFNSPYPAHRSMTGIDIYPGSEFGGLAPSPIEGRLIAIRRVKAPGGGLFEDAGYDVLTLYESPEDPGVVVKMLHLEPAIKLGEVVAVGEMLGRLLRSGYFDFWTSPHLHLEVRRASDPIRARGGYRLKRTHQPEIGEPQGELRGTVSSVRPEYALINLQGGAAARVGDTPILLDGGIPHYRWLGLHSSTPLTGGVVELCGRPIAVIEESYGDCAIARCEGPRFEVKGQRVGLSLYLPTEGKAPIKLIPARPGALKLVRGEEVSIEIFGGGLKLKNR